MNILLRWSSACLFVISFFSLANEPRISAEYLLDEISTDLRSNIATGDTNAIRFKLAGSAIVKAAVLWDKEGNILFPIKGELSHVNDDLILRDILRFDLLLATANPVKWEQRDASALIFHYCRKDIASSCLIIDVIELSAQLGVKHKELLNAVLVIPTFSSKYSILFVFLLFIIFCSLFIFYQRRSHTKPAVVDAEFFTLGDLIVKPKQQIGIRDSLTISLTSRDIKLLTFMALHPSEVLSKDQLYSAGWGREFLPNSRALEQHIMVLRRKLDPEKKRQVLIETVHGQGYKCPLPQ
ncbi:MAG: hypothetical protein COA59_05925 [Colwellia sp.]|nr:MAG: hypothetical protein COA59_05925 [Colwellia sp.]